MPSLCWFWREIRLQSQARPQTRVDYMKKNYLGFLMCAASLLWVAGWQCAVAKDEAPAEWDGLVKRKIKGLDLVYVRPDVRFPAYKKIMLDPVQVEFSKNWKPNSGTRSLSQQIGTGTMQWTTSVTNRAEADRAISMWASKLVDALDRLNRKGS